MKWRERDREREREREHVCAKMMQMKIRRNECFLWQNRLRFKGIREGNLGNSKIGRNLMKKLL